jgi:hypothetical protein
MIPSRFDPPKLARGFSREWIDSEAAVVFLRERMGLPPFARADGQAALHILEHYGFVEREGRNVRRAAVQPEWPPPKSEPKPQQFISLVDRPPERINEINHIPSAPWAIGFTERPAVHVEPFNRPA